MRRSIAGMAMLASACAKPMPTAPVPLALSSPLAPAAAVQRAGAVLVGAGFAVTASDAAAGLLTATNERDATKMAPEISCYYGPDAIAARNTRLLMTVSVSAVPAKGGSAVRLSSRVRQTEGESVAAITRQLGGSNHIDDACASTGEIEKRLAAALAAQ
jgi:hypothetical protein